MRESWELWLRESWELWYWAMFCPSRLQERMNEWSPAKERSGTLLDTTFQDILLYRLNWRFIFQFIQITCFFSLPLVAAIPIYGQSWDWLLLPIILLIAYSGVIGGVPVHLNVPLIIIPVYLAKPTFFVASLDKAIGILPPLPQIGMGILIGTLGLVITNFLGFSILKRNLFLARSLLVFGSTLSVCSSSWISSHNLLFTFLIGGVIGFFLLIFQNEINSEDNGGSVIVIIDIVLVVVAGIVAGGIAGIVTVSIAGIIAGIVAIIFAVTVAIIFAGIAVRTATYVPKSVNMFAVKFLRVNSAETIVTGSFVVSFKFVIVKIIANIFSNLLITYFTIIITGYIAFVVAFVVASFFAGCIASISTLSLTTFLILCCLVGASLSPNRQKWLGLTAAVVMCALRIEHEAWELMLAILITLIGYYRVLPEFGIFSIFNLLTISIFRRSLLFPLSLTLFDEVLQPILDSPFTDPFQLLSLLPPFTSELLWLPLPNHARLLIASFRQNPLKAIPIFQSIQKQPLYGFQQTIINALPQLATDQLIAVQNIPEIIAIGTPNHEILSFFAPLYYSKALPDYMITNIELIDFLEGYSQACELLPTFQKYAQNIDAAIQAGSIALRERGLERILDQLSTLNSQLSGLVKSKSIPRWQNVIKQWQTIIQQELEQLQRQSQGEILNPFQYGNPLTRDRAQLFKGRSAFADQIVRQILDRNRPTIILHGPRRCGKSSFLLNLPRLLTSDVLPVYIDLQSQSASQSEADFWFTIVRAIHRDARSQQVLLPAQLS